MIAETESLPLLSKTPPEWGSGVLRDPIALLIDHAFLEKKAATNALELLTKWPEPFVTGWVQTMTDIARDEAAHLSQVTRLISRRGGRLERIHKNPYANALRQLVRKGAGKQETIDRLLISAMIECRSCERFSVLAQTSEDAELGKFYARLYASELGHYLVFLKLAGRVLPATEVEARWRALLEREAEILAAQPPGPRIHSGMATASETCRDE